jgi:hypothetical protein
MTEEEREAEQVRIWKAIKELVADLKRCTVTTEYNPKTANRVRANAAYLESLL